eukprot:486326_1
MSTYINPFINFIAYAVTATCGGFMCLILLVTHSYQYYQNEILTPNVKKSKQKQSFVYKLMSLLTMITLTLFTLIIIIATAAKCICYEQLDASTSVIYQLSKCCMYLIFV